MPDILQALKCGSTFMSKLVDKQSQFVAMVMQLIKFAHDLSYQVTFGEAERSEETAMMYFKKGIGIINSKHCQRLAIDLNFYKQGKLIDDRVSLESIGLYWESLGGIWGGRFKKYDDSRHFEMK